MRLRVNRAHGMARILRDPVQDLIEGLVELLNGLPLSSGSTASIVKQR